MISSPLYVRTYLPQFTDAWGEDKLRSKAQAQALCLVLLKQLRARGRYPVSAEVRHRAPPGYRHSRLVSRCRRSVVTDPRQQRSQGSRSVLLRRHSRAGQQSSAGRADGHQRRVHSTAATRSPSSPLSSPLLPLLSRTSIHAVCMFPQRLP